MIELSNINLIPVLQTAIGPVVLISGVGLLILSMTNRLGRVVDRGRSLVREIPLDSNGKKRRLDKQLSILSKRAELLKQAITYATISVLCAALLVIVLFFSATFQSENTGLIILLFIVSMFSLIISLLRFLQDINQSLVAFRLDISE